MSWFYDGFNHHSQHESLCGLKIRLFKALRENKRIHIAPPPSILCKGIHKISTSDMPTYPTLEYFK